MVKTIAERLRHFLRSPAFLLFLLGLIFVYHLAASFFGWYERDALFGSPNHFLGGAWVACAVIFFAKTRSALISLPSNPWGRIAVIVAYVALAGVMWELFEFFIDNTLLISMSPYLQSSLGDTMGDLALDIAGGAFFAVIAARHSR